MLISVALVGVLVALSAALVAFGSGLLVVDRARLDAMVREGSRRARVPLRLLARPGHDLTAVHLGVIGCGLGLGALVDPVAGLLAGDASSTMRDPARPWLVATVLLAVMTLQIVLGEMVPRSVGAQRPLGTVLSLGVAVRALTWLVVPVAAAADAVAQRATAALGADRSEVRSRMGSREELRRLVQLSERSGAIRPVDAELFDRTLRFGDKTAADALAPRVEVESLPLDADVGDLIDRSAATGFSRFPVTGEDLDDIVGIVHVKDVLGVPAPGRRSQPLSELMRPVLAVPESKELEPLMVELRDAAGQFAIVVDEYGGTAGIITLEDLIEEIVGDIADEHDPAMAAPTVRRWGGAHLLAGSLHADEVVEACGFEVPDGDYETLGGYVMAALGRVPSVGDAFSCGGWEVEVSEMDGRRVRTVKMVAPSPGAVELLDPSGQVGS